MVDLPQGKFVARCEECVSESAAARDLVSDCEHELRISSGRIYCIKCGGLKQKNGSWDPSTETATRQRKDWLLL